jgi:hypothetical protein
VAARATFQGDVNRRTRLPLGLACARGH